MFNDIYTLYERSDLKTLTNGKNIKYLNIRYLDNSKLLRHFIIVMRVLAMKELNCAYSANAS